MRIDEIEGIGPVYAKTLADKAGITTVEQLLEAGAKRKGRETLAEKTGISGSQILKWVNMADLFRIKGVGQEYSELLEAGGVDTVKELARRVPENLVVAMTEANDKKKLVRRLPTASMVADWVKQAKEMPPKVEY
jgi:predicted flap endonuclease-1-like 5' DNA nuclease